MKRKVAQQETLVNHQDTAEIKQFPQAGVSSQETKGEPGQTVKSPNEKLAEWALAKREAQNMTGNDLSLGKSMVSKIEHAKIKEVPIDTLHALATGLRTTIDEPLRVMGYLPADAVVVRGELGRLMASLQEIPEDWRVIVSELTGILHRRAQKEAKRGNG